MASKHLVPDSSRQPINIVASNLGSTPGRSRPNMQALLSLVQEDTDLFRSDHVEANFNGAVFGGQLIAQALRAAAHDIPPGQPAHCLQINFLAPGLLEQPMRYQVRQLLHGKRFQIRHVLGIQGERIVVSANVSFHRGEWGPQRQHALPSGVPRPEALESIGSYVARHAERVPDQIVKRTVGARSAEIRPIDPETFLFQRNQEARLRYWVRAPEALQDDTFLHQAAMGYISDFWFPLTAIVAHVDRKLQTGLYTASLNHVIWFHGPARMDDWLLVDASSPFSGQGRGLSQAQVYTRDGQLVASWAQEGLLRGWVERDGMATAPGDMPDSAPANGGA